MTITATPIHPHIGAEIAGLDLSRPIDAWTMSVLWAALTRHAVLVLRDQQIGEDELRAIAARFGCVDIGCSAAHDASLLDNKPAKGRGNREGEDVACHLWHTDKSILAARAGVGFLFAGAAVAATRETDFADMRVAYDALTDEQKVLVEPLVVEYDGISLPEPIGFGAFSTGDGEASPPRREPLISPHPGSQRKVLALSAHASHLVGWPAPEGALLLNDLHEHATQPQFVYRHRWRPRDLVIWDNACTMHRRCPPDEAKPPRRNRQSASADFIADAFTVPLVDLGRENPKYLGVFTPESEVGKEKIGVSDFLLGRAKEYFEKFQHYDYIFELLGRAIAIFPEPLRGLALDIGSGFGNTVIPLLERYDDLSVIATDISPDLLAILKSEAASRGFSKRCGLVAMDAHGDYFVEGVADAAFGCAVLHHLVDPLLAVRNVLKALRPGGRAVFLEPFQAGHMMTRIAYEQILDEARRRGEWGRAFDFLRALIRDIHVRTHQRVLPDTGIEWHQLDDKWLFTRTHFEAIGNTLNVSDLIIEQIHTSSNPFTNQAEHSLIHYGGIASTELPEWGWQILRRFDEEFCSPELKIDLVMEGIVTFVR